MARIASVVIPSEKQVWIALTYVYGIGRTTSKKILAGHYNFVYYINYSTTKVTLPPHKDNNSPQKKLLCKIKLLYLRGAIGAPLWVS